MGNCLVFRTSTRRHTPSSCMRVSLCSGVAQLVVAWTSAGVSWSNALVGPAGEGRSTHWSRALPMAAATREAGEHTAVSGKFCRPLKIGFPTSCAVALPSASGRKLESLGRRVRLRSQWRQAALRTKLCRPTPTSHDAVHWISRRMLEDPCIA